MTEGISIKELAPFVSRKTIHKRIESGEWRTLGMVAGVMLLDLLSLPQWLQAKVNESRLVNAAALAPPAVAPNCAKNSADGPQMFLIPRTPIDRQIAELKVEFPPSQAVVAIKRYRIIEPLLNGDFRRRGHENKTAYVKATGRAETVPQSTIYLWLARFKENGLAALTNDRPGPEPGTGAMLDASDRAFLKAAWLGLPRADDIHELPLSKRACRAALIKYLTSKQKAWRAARAYEIPSQSTVDRYIQSIPEHEKAIARYGHKHFLDTCGRYISRDPSSLASNDVWVTDQRLVDVRLRDGGEKLGRIWTVNFLDVSSWKWLGCAFGPILSNDMVMRAAVMALGRYGIPGAVHEDRGKEFQCRAFNGGFATIRGEKLFEEAEGLWQRLDVSVIEAIGRNPKSKTIERWHEEVARFDKSFPGATGSNTNERPELTAELEAEHEAWKAGKAKGTRLLKIEHYIARFFDWCENEWNKSPHGGKYLRGMTPDEAYRCRMPDAGARTIPLEQLDLLTADRRRLKVARGGQINIQLYGQRIEYEAQELFSRQGEEVIVLVSRGTLSRVEVYDAREQHICTAPLKPLYDWIPEDREQLRQALRCNAAMHRAVRRGLDAQRRAIDIRTPMDAALATAEPATRAAARRIPTSSQLAEEVLAMEE
jgi:hypothetical protein